MRKKKRQGKIYALFILISIVLISGIVVIEQRMSELVIDIARQKVKSQAYIIISETIWREIDESGVTYDSLVGFEKDTQGNIRALKTDIIQVNKLKSKLSLDILHALENKEEMTVFVPLGSIFGTEVLSGFGPKIKIDVVPVGNVAADMENVIESAGINQTRHQIMMNINVKLSIVGMFKRSSVSVGTNVCIAETVIVGNVPESYTSIYASENEEVPESADIDSDIIFDFVY